MTDNQHNLGNLYAILHDYAKAQEYLLKALENRTQLLAQNPDAYRADLASTQWNLMLLYEVMKSWEKYDEMLELVLKNYEILAQENSQYQERVDELRDRKQQRAAAKGQ